MREKHTKERKKSRPIVMGGLSFVIAMVLLVVAMFDIILEETTILPFNPNWLFLIAGILGGLGFVLLSKKDWRA